MNMPNAQNPLKIGTRGSPLALAQAIETRRRLMSTHHLAEDACEIVIIKTTGDDRALIVADRPLKEIGNKGLFTKEIEEAMLAGAIDIAVHSTKDMPVEQPAGLVLDCYLPREDVRDAFMSSSVARLADLPEGAVVGSSSLRRRAQLANRRPDLKLVEFRGNVQTRLKKLNDGVAAATFLAMAGLNRLGMAALAKGAVEVEEMLPAVGAGRHRDRTARRRRAGRGVAGGDPRRGRPASGWRPSGPSSRRSTGRARRRLPGWPSMMAAGFGSAARSCAPTGPK